MGSALDRLIAAHSTPHSAAPDPGDGPGEPSALDRLIAAHQTKHASVLPTPSAGEQVVEGLKQVGSFFRHPIDAVEGVVKGAGHSVMDAISPVAGTSNVTPGATRFGDDAAIQASRHPHTYQMGEPGVVSPDVQRRGVINTAANVGFLAAPELAAPARVAVNAGLGAMNDPEERIRGAVAGTVLGEVLHAPQAIKHVTDFGDGMVEAGVKGMHEQVAEDSKLWNDGRRPAKTLPENQRPAVEPKADAATVSAGGEEMSALDKLIAGYTYRAARGGLPENADVVRRPRESIPMEQRSPVEPPPEAQTVSVGGTVKRRPGGVKLVETPEPTPPAPTDVLQMNGQQDEPQTPGRATELATPVSYGPRGEIDDSKPVLTPLVSSNGQFDARPGVLAKVNKDLGVQTDTPVPMPPGRNAFAEQPPVDPSEVKSFGGDAASPVTEAPPRPSDILNVAKLNLSDQTAEQRVAQQLEQYRSMRDANKQTFAEADVNRAAIVKELTASDPKALSPAAAKRLSGEELLARRDVVRQNDDLIANLSKAIESKTLPLADHEQAVELLNKAVQHNDALLSDLVLGSSQKGRDLNLLRRMANRSLDPDVWQVQAKRMLGDRPLTDEMSATIRRLAQEAADACAGGAS